MVRYDWTVEKKQVNTTHNFYDIQKHIEIERVVTLAYKPFSIVRLSDTHRERIKYNTVFS